MDLKQERQNLIAQRDNAWAVYHQAIGALTLIDALIQEQQEPANEMTVQALGEMLGAKEIGEPEAL